MQAMRYPPRIAAGLDDLADMLSAGRRRRHHLVEGAEGQRRDCRGRYALPRLRARRASRKLKEGAAAPSNRRQPSFQRLWCFQCLRCFQPRTSPLTSAVL